MNCTDNVAGSVERGSELQHVAEAAAAWVMMLPEATERERLAFEHWLLASPLHIREYLLAAHIDEELRKIDPKRLRSVDLSVGTAARNVIAFIPNPAPA